MVALLPQRLKSTFLYVYFFTRLQVSSELLVRSNFVFFKVDFSLWGRQSNFSNSHFFLLIISPLYKYNLREKPELLISCPIFILFFWWIQRKFLSRKYPYISSTRNVAGVEMQNKNSIFPFMCSKNSWKYTYTFIYMYYKISVRHWK